MKQAAQALGEQLQQLSEQQVGTSSGSAGHSGSAAAAASAGRAGREPQERLDFSFRLPTLDTSAGLSADLSGFASSSACSQQQSAEAFAAATAQEPFRALGTGAGAAVTAADAGQRWDGGEPATGAASTSLSGQVSPAGATAAEMLQQQQAATAISTGQCVSLTVEALSQLQAAVQHHQRRCGKWKAKCKQLAQHLGVLNAELQQARLMAAADAGAASQEQAAAPPAAEPGPVGGACCGGQQQQVNTQQLAHAVSAAAAEKLEVKQLRQQLAAAQQVRRGTAPCR